MLCHEVPAWPGWKDEEESNVLCHFWIHSVECKEYHSISFFRSPPTSSCGYMGLKANWSQCCPIWDWSRLLRPLICLVWWALVEVIQPLNLSAYLSNSWANTHSPSALGLIFKHLEKTGPSVYASIFPSHLHLILFCRLYAEQGLDPLLWQKDILNFLRINTVCFPAHSLQNSSGDPIG